MNKKYLTAKQAGELRFNNILNTIKELAFEGFGSWNTDKIFSESEINDLKKLGYKIDAKVTKVWGIFDSTETRTVISWRK